MRLIEISNRIEKNMPMMIALAKATVSAISNGHDDEEGTQALQFIGANIDTPEYAPFLYQGKMYRLIMLDGEEHANTNIDMQMITNYVKNESKVKVFSFSKTQEGIENWEEMGSDPYGAEIHIILEQTGKGFDIQKIYRYIKQFPKDTIKDNLDMFALGLLQRAGGSEDSVLEVIAPYNSTLRIVDTETKYEDDDYEDDDPDDE